MVVQVAKESDLVAAQDMTLELVESFLDITLPWLRAGVAIPFDALKPRLCDSKGVTAFGEVIKILQRCFIEELLLPWVERGVQAKGSVAFAAPIIAKETADVEDHLDNAGIVACIKDISETFYITSALLSPIPGAFPVSTETLKSFADASKTPRSSQKKVLSRQ